MSIELRHAAACYQSADGEVEAVAEYVKDNYVSDYNQEVLEEIEKNMIRKAAEQFGNNHTKIATALGLSRQALYRRLEKYGIRLPE